MLAKGAAHLVAGEVGGFAGLLHRHAELNDVEEELQEILVLRVAALHGKAEKGTAIGQCKTGRESYTRAFARRHDIVGVLGRIEHGIVG